MGTSPCLTTTNTIKDKHIKVLPPPVSMEQKNSFFVIEWRENNFCVCFLPDKSKNKNPIIELIELRLMNLLLLVYSLILNTFQEKAINPSLSNITISTLVRYLNF